MSDKRVDDPSGDERVRSSYTAWDGAERRWPPPENWYRAADGRWWHPAYGPDDQPDSLPVWNTTGRSPDLSSFEPPMEPGSASDPESPSDTENSTLATNTNTNNNTGTAAAAAAAAKEFGHDTERGIDVGGGTKNRTTAIGVAIAVGVLGVAAVAQIVLGGATADDRGGSDRQPAAVIASDDLDTSTDGRENGGESAAGSDPGVVAAVAEFRQVMSGNGLSTQELTDEDIATFASAYCGYASGAEDQAAFDELRGRAVATSQSSLSPAQLNLTISTAVTVFCPAESDRLALGSDSSAP